MPTSQETSLTSQPASEKIRLMLSAQSYFLISSGGTPVASESFCKSLQCSM